MKKHLQITGLLALFLLLFAGLAEAQCTFLPQGIPGPTLTTVSGTGNRSGVAWNPGKSLYYSVNAGSGSYPIETYADSGGTSVASVAAGISFRGLWWNDSLSQLEGNGHGTTGIRKQDLDPTTGYALGTGTAIFTGQNQPNSQSCGDLDYDDNEIIYYDNGSIYRYSRATNASLGNYTLNNMPAPVTDILDYGVVYTGCSGHEVGIYNYINQVVYLFDKATGNFADSIPLPASAPQPPSFGFSFANDLVWVFDGTGRIWYSYEIFDRCTPPTANAVPQGSPNICEGDTVILMADTATGQTYQWQLDGVDIAGATGDLFAADTTGDYTVIVSNSPGCSDTSGAIIVTVSALPTAMVTPGGAVDFCEGNTVMLGAMTGMGYTYQWQLNGMDIPGATDSTYTADTTGSYSVKVTSAAGCEAISNAVAVQSFPSPVPMVSVNVDTLSTSNTYASYQWNQNGSPISGATDYFYVATATGTYSVSVVDSNGCEGISDTTGFTVGLQPQAIAGQVVLFPNPGHDQVWVRMENDAFGQGNIQLYNLMGQVQMTLGFEKTALQFEAPLDLSRLAAGIYWVEISLGDQLSRIRLIKE